MPFPWLIRRKRPTKARGRPSLLVELLESRELLSFATPDDIPFNPKGGAGSFDTSSPTGTTPTQIRQAYGINQISFNGAAGDGTGTTIAIVDAFDDPNIANDLQQFDLEFNLPNPTFTKVNQSGGSTMPPSNASWITEIALDVEWSHAIAPSAKILLVEANDNSDANLYAAVRYAASVPGVVAVSMSWGDGETPDETSIDSSTFVTPSGHTGVTFIASSGDNGAPPSYPAASPNVLAVGGTTLDMNASGNILSEAGWSGSGGGISVVESQPSYQNGVVTQSTSGAPTPTWPTTPTRIRASLFTIASTMGRRTPGASGAAPATRRRNGPP